ncbi:MAG: elongation factor, partial [Actinomycetota bacterium]
KNKLVRDMKIGVNVGKPRVSYRETITGQANDVRGLFKKQSGGRGQFGDAVVTVMPITPEEAEAADREVARGDDGAVGLAGDLAGLEHEKALEFFSSRRDECVRISQPLAAHA